MNITEVRVRLLNKEDSVVKAFASITIDNCFVVHDIKILQIEESYVISMPRKQNQSGKFVDIAHPINSETRLQVDKMIIDEYKRVLAEEEAK